VLVQPVAECRKLGVDAAPLISVWNARDCRPTTSVFPSPRINWNIDVSAGEAKTAFVHNRYLNVQPRKPDGTNGSDRIGNHPELSRAIELACDLEPWVPPASGGYEVRCFDGSGRLERTTDAPRSTLRLAADPLESSDMILFEIVRR